VVADNYQPSAWSESLYGLLQSGFQIVQFSIDGNPQGLEGAGGRMNTALGRSCSASYHLRKVGRASEGPVLDQSPCDGPGAAVFSVTPDEASQFLLAATVDDGCRGGAWDGCVEPHVEGFFPPKAEAAA